MKQVLLWIVAGIALLLLWAIQPPLPPRIGQIDFAAYWSASYLLARGENAADPARLLIIEKTLTTYPEDYPMLTWNPPWLFPLLIPYTWAPFTRAVWWWLLTNIALVFASSIALWRINAVNERTRRLAWLAPLIAFAFVPTLTALIAGQVNTIVLAGVAVFLFCSAWQKHTCAGVALALALVKPHLVYLTVPLLLLDGLHRRCWRMLVGFCGTLGGLSVIVLVMRPSFIFDYGMSVGGGRLLDYETPTLGTFLTIVSGWSGFKWMGLIILPVAVAIGWRAGALRDRQTWVDVTLIGSLFTSPFGWSYDNVVLLVPLLHAILLIIESKFRRAEVLGIGMVLFAANAFAYYQRILTPSEFYFVWIPILIAAFYAYVWMRRRQIAYA